MQRAYSLLSVKRIDDAQRVIEGIASTPTPDRGGHVMDPAGAKFSLPLPLLWFHKQDDPIGEVFEADVRPDGIHIKARVSVVTKPGRLKNLVDEAWAAFTADPMLVRGLSIGWAPIEAEALANGIVKFTQWVWGELSAVTVPMNAEATILSVKQADLAASGRHPPGDSGTLPVVRAVKAAPAMTVAEQITQFEATRAAKSAAALDIMNKAASKGETLDGDQADQYDGLQLEVKSIDAHLVRLRDLDRQNAIQATAVTKVLDVKTGSDVRGGSPVVSVRPNIEKGSAFTRYAIAKVMGKGSRADAIAYAESRRDWMDQTPEVVLALKAAVNPGTIAEPAWAAPLAQTRPMQDEFLELLRPVTLIGQITGLKRVPFNISIPVQTGGGTYQWVGEAASKPVGNLQMASATLPIAKAAGIIVISEELAKLSNPSAEAVIRNDMIKGMAQYLDQQFIDPTVAAVTNVSPASITNGTNGYATAGTSGDNARTDIKKGINLMLTGNYPVTELVFIMSEANAFALSAALTSNGQPLFPGMTMRGGNLFGVPVYTSQSAGSVVATVHTPSILFADDGGVNIDVSREASVEMNTTPTSPVTASSAYVSLWQLNLVGLRAERFINWKRVPRPTAQAVVYTTATYV